MARTNRTIAYRAVVFGLLAASIGLSACGRKGALEAPYGGVADPAVTAEPAPAKPDKPFILDPLL